MIVYRTLVLRRNPTRTIRQRRFSDRILGHRITLNKIEPHIIIATFVCCGRLWAHDSRRSRSCVVSSVLPHHFPWPVIPAGCHLCHVFLAGFSLCWLGLVPVQQSFDGGANRNADTRATVRKRDFHVAEVSASRTEVRSSSSLNGFVRNAEAPAFRAVERTSGSSFPVKMMTRVDGEISRSCDCTSSPLICGMQTSTKATSGRCLRA